MQATNNNTIPTYQKVLTCVPIVGLIYGSFIALESLKSNHRGQNDAKMSSILTYLLASSLLTVGVSLASLIVVSIVMPAPILIFSAVMGIIIFSMLGFNFYRMHEAYHPAYHPEPLAKF